MYPTNIYEKIRIQNELLQIKAISGESYLRQELSQKDKANRGTGL